MQVRVQQPTAGPRVPSRQHRAGWHVLMHALRARVRNRLLELGDPRVHPLRRWELRCQRRQRRDGMHDVHVLRWIFLGVARFIERVCG